MSTGRTLESQIAHHALIAALDEIQSVKDVTEVTDEHT